LVRVPTKQATVEAKRKVVTALSPFDFHQIGTPSLALF